MSRNALRQPLALAAAGALCVVALGSGCRNSGTTSSSPRATSAPPATPPSSDRPATVAAAPPAPAAKSNKWFPLEPGYQSVSLGTLNRGHRKLEHRRVVTVTNVTKVIDGTRATLVLDQDFDGGELAEQAVDYLATDDQGNILYLGSYTEAYEGGQFVNASDVWLAGVKGATRGTLVPGDPKTGTPPFTEANIPGEDKKTGRVIKTTQSACVPFKCYTDVVVIQEEGEYKYFAAGVGQIKTEPQHSGGEQEIEELVNFTQLSPQGMTEISAEALKLDQHARETARGVFGNSQPAERPS